MLIQLQVALTHLTGRRRQTLVSLTGVVLGVAFFLAVSSLMRGSERDFIKRLVDNSAHITVSDDYRRPRTQPAELRWADGAVAISHVQPQTETRGIRGYREKLAFVGAIPGLRAAPVLAGSAVLTFAGREEGVSLWGVVPKTLAGVSTIEEKMIAGSLGALDANPNGIIIGAGLAKKFNLGLGRNLSVAAANGSARAMKVVGIFRTGNANYDETQSRTNSPWPPPSPWPPACWRPISRHAARGACTRSRSSGAPREHRLAHREPGAHPARRGPGDPGR